MSAQWTSLFFPTGPTLALKIELLPAGTSGMLFCSHVFLIRAEPRPIFFTWACYSATRRQILFNK